MEDFLKQLACTATSCSVADSLCLPLDFLKVCACASLALSRLLCSPLPAEDACGSTIFSLAIRGPFTHCCT
jgi:hypothetical protein